MMSPAPSISRKVSQRKSTITMTGGGSAEQPFLTAAVEAQRSGDHGELEKILSPGRRIWNVVHFEGLEPFVIGPLVVVHFQKFLPAGTYEIDGYIVTRDRSLVQVYTDPGGTRTLAVADVRLKDPGRAKK